MRSVYADNGRARWVHRTLTRPAGTRACGPTSSCCTGSVTAIGSPHLARLPDHLCPFSVSQSRRHCQTSRPPPRRPLCYSFTTCIMLCRTSRATIIVTTYDHAVRVEHTQHAGLRSKMGCVSRLGPEGSPELRIRVFIPLWCPLLVARMILHHKSGF
ncbi:hypothetical protein EDB87DRAFT_440198 [Lactarius vividus]|nr:hypothetical protein EDB87DRAFT_440198 [Lactarius vividus]